MKKETFEKILLVALITGGLGYSYVTYLLSPQLSRLESLNNELQTKVQHYEQLLSYEGDWTTLEEEIKRLHIQKSELTAEVPSSLDKPRLMLHIYSIARAAQVESISLTFEPIINSGDVQSMVMNYSGQGKISDLLSFTKKIQYEETPRLGIQSIALVNQSGNVKADIKLVAYASKLQGEEASSQVPSPEDPGLTSIEQMFQP